MPGAWMKFAGYLALVVASIALARSYLPVERLDTESTTLVLLVAIPVAFGIYAFRGSMADRKTWIQLIAISGFGIFLASLIVPRQDQHILSAFAYMKPVTLFIAVILEAALFVMVVKSIFSDRPTEEKVQQLAQDVAVPAWLGRIMVAEAQMWKYVARRLHNLLTRR